MTTKDAIKHLSDKIDYAEQCDDKWVDSVSIKALYIAVRAMAEERKKGKWEEKTVLYDDLSIEQWQSARCSVCDKYHTTPYSYYFFDYKYCPYCGAEMSQGEENEGN